MLMGKYQNSIDAKSRMIIPSKCRDDLGASCVLTRGIDKCLYVYPMGEWNKFMEKLSKLPTSDSKARAFVRHFYANAIECEMDKQGRITLSQELREYASIDKELITVGVIDKLEIWAREEWEREAEEMRSSTWDMAEKMAEYGI